MSRLLLTALFLLVLTGKVWAMEMPCAQASHSNTAHGGHAGMTIDPSAPTMHEGCPDTASPSHGPCCLACLSASLPTSVRLADVATGPPPARISPLHYLGRDAVPPYRPPRPSV